MIDLQGFLALAVIIVPMLTLFAYFTYDQNKRHKKS